MVDKVAAAIDDVIIDMVVVVVTVDVIVQVVVAMECEEDEAEVSGDEE